MGARRVGFRLPVAYRAFFLLVEPLAALVAAFYSHFRPKHYLEHLDAASAPSEIPAGTSAALSQLASMYLFLALNETLVLRSTWDLRVWRTVVLVLLVADLGHLYSIKELGPGAYCNLSNWRIPWLYVGVALRTCFLAGVGLGESKRMQTQG